MSDLDDSIYGEPAELREFREKACPATLDAWECAGYMSVQSEPLQRIKGVVHLPINSLDEISLNATKKQWIYRGVVYDEETRTTETLIVSVGGYGVMENNVRV